MRWPWALSAVWLCLRCTYETTARGPCQRDADCPGAICAAYGLSQTADLHPPPLACTPAMGDGADPGAQCERCADCGHGLCLISGHCAEPCQGPTDCDPGSRCQPAWISAEERTHPVQVCLNFTPADLPHERAEQAVNVGEQSLMLEGTHAPAFYVVEFLGPSQWPFGMLCRTPLCPLQLSTREQPPRTLFDLSGSEPPANPIPHWPFAYPFTVYVGSGDDPAYSDRGYGLKVLAEAAGQAQITRVEAATDRALDAPLRLDLHLYYVGAAGLSPAGERGPEPIALALDEVDRILAQARVAVRVVGQRAVPGAILERGVTFPQQDPRQGLSHLQTGYGLWPELPGLFALSAGARDPALNLFFVADIAGMEDGEVQALAGGTPGPPGMHGTGASGIAIATDMLLPRPAQLGRTLAHEIGHYLGLLHTTEADGAEADALGDTPRCPTTADRDLDNQLNGSECADYDAENLMFWAQGSGTDLTATQRVILRRAPLLHPP